MIDGDTVFEPATVRRLVAPFADPAGRCGRRATRGSAEPAQPDRALAAHRVRDRVQHRPAGARTPGACIPTVPGAVGAFRRAALTGVGGVSDDTLAEDTDLTIAIGPRRLAGGLRADRPRLDRGARDARAAVAAALPVELRDHAVDVEAPPRGGRARPLGPPRPGRAAADRPVPDRAAAARADGGRLPGLRAGLPRPGRGPRCLGVALLLQLPRAWSRSGWSGEPLRALWLLPLQQFVYRQLMYAVLIQSVASAVAGTRLRWQKIPRAGRFSAAPLDLAATVPIPRRGGPAVNAARPAAGAAARPGADRGLRHGRCRPPPATARAPRPTPPPTHPAAHGTVNVYVTVLRRSGQRPAGQHRHRLPQRPARHRRRAAGSYADPITLATDPRELPPGTVVYDAAAGRSTSSWRTTARSASTSGERTTVRTSTCGPGPTGGPAARLRGSAHPSRAGAAGDQPAGRPTRSTCARSTTPPPTAAGPRHAAERADVAQRRPAPATGRPTRPSGVTCAVRPCAALRCGYASVRVHDRDPRAPPRGAAANRALAAQHGAGRCA